MAIILPSNSRYKKTDQVVVNGKTSFGLASKFNFLDKNFVGDNKTKIIVNERYKHNPSLIAFDYYGDATLYWVVVLYNSPRSIFRWPELNTEIEIPNSNLVISQL